MRVLYLTPYVPSPIRVRPYELLRALVGQGMRPTVLCPASAEDRPEIAALRDRQINVQSVPVTTMQRARAVVLGAAAGLPLQAAYGVPGSLVRRLEALLAAESFDVVHIEHLRAAALLPLVRQLPVVYDAVDCISLLLERTIRAGPDRRTRLLAALELRRTRAFESAVCRASGWVAVTSPEDATALRALCTDAEVRVVANGVDLERFAPSVETRAKDVVVFTGKMGYHANVAAAVRLVEQIMPLVWRERPAAQLWLVGSNPPRRLQRFASDPRVHVTGRVPEIVSFLQRASVAVSPLRYGVGVQNKVLEAMATATPVVIDYQSQSALQARHGEELVVAGDDHQFAAAILELLADAKLRDRLGQAGRAYVETTHRWSQSATTLAQLYGHAKQAHKHVPAIQHLATEPLRWR